MSLAELKVIEGFIERAICPEDVFGKIDGGQAEHALKQRFHMLAKALHPDVHNGDSCATSLAGHLFDSLKVFHEEAVKRVAAGTYGQRTPMPGKEPIIVKGKYVIEKRFRAGDIADLHLAFLESSTTRTKPFLLKVARQSADNDLLRAESEIIKRLREKLPATSWRNAIPNIVESFLLDEGRGMRRRVNVMQQETGFVDAEEIRRRLPQGVDGRTLAWMWKRLLILIEWTGKCGFVHGAIFPPHLMFYPDNDGGARDQRKHSIRVVDWCYAVEYKNRTRLSAWVPAWKAFYAPEVLAKKPLSPTTDLFMGAATMLWLSGGEVREDGFTVGESIRGPIGDSIMRCLQADPQKRPQSIGKYFEGFVELLRKEYGPPKWHDFVLPSE